VSESGYTAGQVPCSAMFEYKHTNDTIAK
jgi:hypothetical protein